MSAQDILAEARKLAHEYVEVQSSAEEPDHPETLAILARIGGELTATIIRLDKVTGPMTQDDAIRFFFGTLGSAKSTNPNAATFEIKATSDVFVASLLAVGNRVEPPKNGKKPKTRRAK